jgi:hypothetical protein
MFRSRIEVEAAVMKEDCCSGVLITVSVLAEHEPDGLDLTVDPLDRRLRNEECEGSVFVILGSSSSLPGADKIHGNAPTTTVGRLREWARKKLGTAAARSVSPNHTVWGISTLIPEGH